MSEGGATAVPVEDRYCLHFMFETLVGRFLKVTPFPIRTPSLFTGPHASVSLFIVVFIRFSFFFSFFPDPVLLFHRRHATPSPSPSLSFGLLALISSSLSPPPPPPPPASRRLVLTFVSKKKKKNFSLVTWTCPVVRRLAQGSCTGGLSTPLPPNPTQPPPHHHPACLHLVPPHPLSDYQTIEMYGRAKRRGDSSSMKT
ncbi:unnamed protein product [Gadus morhua 'NCC']